MSDHESWPAHRDRRVTEPGAREAWLIEANKGWKQRADIATERANSAERSLLAESTERKRLADSRQLWRRLTISGYTYFGGYTGIVEWHWSRYAYLACGFIATATWLTIEEIEARRAKRRKAATR